MSRAIAGALVLALALGAGGASAEAPAGADSETKLRHLSYRHCDPRDRERLVFLETRLEENQGYARWWWHGWNAVYGIGLVYDGTFAVVEDDVGKRANHIAGATKAVIGLTRNLWSPATATYGAPGDEDLAEAYGDVPAGDAQVCRQRLTLAEERLREAAHETERQRWHWIPHAVNLGLNATASVLVAEVWDYNPAYWSGLLGLTFGEIRLWSFPYHATDDLEEYETRFGENAAPVVPETTWGVEPWSQGARLVVRF